MLKNIVLAVDAYDADSWSMVRQGFQPFMATDATVHIAHVIPKTDALGPLSQFVPEGFEPPCHSEVHQRKRQRDERSSLRAGQAMARIL